MAAIYLFSSGDFLKKGYTSVKIKNIKGLLIILAEFHKTVPNIEISKKGYTSVKIKNIKRLLIILVEFYKTGPNIEI